MFPPRTPPHVREAHARIRPIHEFLARHERWLAAAGGDACDLALGNPQAMPLEGVVSALADAVPPRDPAWYAYKTSEPAAREVACRSLAAVTGAEYPAENVFLTNGATGAHLVVLQALVGRGDEVIVNRPPWFFYEGMILQAGARPVLVDTLPGTFDLDVEAIAAAITDATRVVIVNSPNNPTGRIYPAGTLARLGTALEAASARLGRPIYLVSDEVYRAVVYDGATFPSPAAFYRNSIVVYSWGKALLTPGQRVGYLALGPAMDDLPALRRLMASSQILAGWAMASALMQHALPALDRLLIDVGALERRRDRFVEGLRACGYEVARPEGAFYVTPRSPIPDDVAFADRLARRGVLCLPGSVVHMPGYLRASLTASDAMIERALAAFAAERHAVRDRVA